MKICKKALGHCLIFVTVSLAISCSSDNLEEVNQKKLGAQKEPLITLNDFEKKVVTLNSPAKRIIALAPHIVENLFTVGLEKNIVGVISHSDYPEEAKSLPIIGHYNGISIEKILSSKPDLVIAWSSGNSAEVIAKLKSLNIPVYLDNPKTLKDITRSLKDFAVMGGRDPDQIENIDAYSNQIRSLKDIYSSKPLLSVFIPIGEQPLRTLSGKHIISDMMNDCGGRNIFSDLEAIAPTVNYENLLALSPQVILIGEKTREYANTRLNNLDLEFLTPGNYTDKDNSKEKDRTLSPYTVHIDPDTLYRHTVRMADAMGILCNKLEEIRQELIPGFSES